MPLFLHRLVAALQERGWQVSLAILAFIFLMGWAGMSTFEPALAGVETYWWWFVVTATTVGYGDVSPATAGGRAVAVLVVVGGVAAMGVVIAQLSSMFTRVRKAFMSGTAQLKAKDHIIVYGYTPGRTDLLLQELEAAEAGEIVLVFSPEDAQENPFPERVLAVRGTLASIDVARRACVISARAVIIDVPTDNDALAVAVSLRHDNTPAHVVAALHDLRSACERMAMVTPAIECVPRAMVPLLAQAAQDPGLTRLYAALMTNQHGHEGYAYRVPNDAGPVAWLDLLVQMKRVHDATLIGVCSGPLSEERVRENPSADFIVSGGMTLYYVAPSRLASIVWPEGLAAASA